MSLYKCLSQFHTGSVARLACATVLNRSMCTDLPVLPLCAEDEHVMQMLMARHVPLESCPAGHHGNLRATGVYERYALNFGISTDDPVRGTLAQYSPQRPIRPAAERLTFALVSPCGGFGMHGVRRRPTSKISVLLTWKLSLPQTFRSRRQISPPHTDARTRRASLQMPSGWSHSMATQGPRAHVSRAAWEAVLPLPWRCCHNSMDCPRRRWWHYLRC